MRTTADYLDELRKKFNAETDGQLIGPTGWRRQVISRYRTKNSTFDDDTAEKVAAWLSVPVEQVLIDMSAQRAKRTEVKKAWSRAAAKVAGAVTVGAGLFLLPMLAGIGAGESSAAPLSLDIHYTNWIILAAALSLAHWLLERFPCNGRTSAPS